MSFELCLMLLRKQTLTYIYKYDDDCKTKFAVIS